MKQIEMRLLGIPRDGQSKTIAGLVRKRLDEHVKQLREEGNEPPEEMSLNVLVLSEDPEKVVSFRQEFTVPTHANEDAIEEAYSRGTLIPIYQDCHHDWPTDALKPLPVGDET